jgi:serine/threonine protein kinase
LKINLYLDLLKKEIGIGDSSQIFLGEKQNTQELRVLKIYHLGKPGTEKYKRNLQSYKRDLTVGLTIEKGNSFLIRYIEGFEEGEYYCIIMEYCSEGDLEELLKKKIKFSEKV